ncbi:hypothetical protein RDI58_007506 [Solanum bulbocastanum]|uniref:Uncharacterized protein n=1 Tax=Solanum bulbocastanum TaxID=147425 RepID=A0AAN8YM75_SOLBU
MHKHIFIHFPFDPGGKLFKPSSIVSIQTDQPRLPRLHSKPPFAALLLIFLAQVEQSVKIAKEFNFEGPVIFGGVDFKTNAHLVAANFSSKMQSTVAAVTAMLQE